jgi:hypothetical protein
MTIAIVLAGSLHICWNQQQFTVTAADLERALATSAHALQPDGSIELEYALSNQAACYVAQECLLTVVFDLTGAYTVRLSERTATVVENTLSGTFQGGQLPHPAKQLQGRAQ